MAEETLPGTADDDGPDSIVLHVDMDCLQPSFECDCNHPQPDFFMRFLPSWISTRASGLTRGVRVFVSG